MGTALLLKEVINKALRSEADSADSKNGGDANETKNLSGYKAKNSLKELNINRLSIEDVGTVLKLRTGLKL